MNKFKKAINELNPYFNKKININLSPPQHYRMRCEFSYKNSSYVMFDKQKNYIYMDRFNVASRPIFNIQPILLNFINDNFLISKNLFQINFRSNNENKILITLIYRKKVNNETLHAIDMLSAELDITIYVRSKNFVYKTNNENFYELVDIGSQQIKIFQSDKTFFQPNLYLYPKMVNFLIENIVNCSDLLELYCGVGSFTIPLSYKFNNIFATENNRESISMLSKTIDVNLIKNINFSRLNAEEVIDVYKGKSFRRLKDIVLTDYNFSHILVDPPRSGLDDKVIDLLNRFENIIYISCNLDTYIRDIKKLTNYKIEKLSIFDQFVDTEHLEIVSILKKINLVT